MHEAFVGDLEGATDHASIRVYMDTVRKWTLGELEPSLPGGENGTSVRTRMLDAVGGLRAKTSRPTRTGSSRWSATAARSGWAPNGWPRTSTPTSPTRP